MPSILEGLVTLPFVWFLKIRSCNIISFFDALIAYTSSQEIMEGMVYA